MKKIILIAFIATSIIFAASNDDINKKLDLLLQKIEQLERKVDKKDKEIEKLKEELHKQQKELKKQEENTKREFAIKSCNKIKVLSLNYKYHDEIIPYYTHKIILKNEYPEGIKYMRGSLFAEDKDRVKILQDYISREVNFPRNSKIIINKKHIVGNELEKYLKDEKTENLNIYFEPTRIEFQNGKILECN